MYIKRIRSVCLGYDEIDNGPFEGLAWCFWKARFVGVNISGERFVRSEVGLG